MQDLAKLSKEQLVQLAAEQASQLATQSDQLATQSDALAAQTKEVTRRDDVIKQLEAKLEEAERDYLKLWRERFAAKSERYIDDPGQLQLDFGDTTEAADAAEGLAEATEEADLIPEHKRRKPRKKRDESFPAHLPRKPIEIDAAEEDKRCEQHGDKTLLPESMWDTVEKLVYVPAQLHVEVRKYKKYACQNQPACGIVSAERPTGITEGDTYDTSVATQILVNKYAYHQPLYRQQDTFAGSGWTPSRGTMLNLLVNCHFII